MPLRRKLIFRSTALVALVGASVIGGPHIAPSTPSSSGATILHDQSNLIGFGANLIAPQTAAADPYVTLQDNFYTFDSCERRRVVVETYKYVYDAYCTTKKQANGRFHLRVWYRDSCPDAKVEDGELDAASTPNVTTAER